MIYGGLLLLVAGVIYVTKRSIAQALIALLASSMLAGLVTADVANLVVGMSPSWPKNLVTAAVRLVILLLPALVILTRSPKQSRDLLFKIIDSALLAVVIVALAGSTMAGLIKLDELSVQAYTLIIQNSKWLLVGAGIYGFYGLLKKPDEA